MPVSEAEVLIRSRIAPVEEKMCVKLADARGRVLADDVLSPIDLPPFDNSAVDGFAVKHGDLNPGAESRAKIAGRIQAGGRVLNDLQPGQAIRIFTGAPLPKGADTVFMQEDCRTDGDFAVLPPGLKAGSNRRLRGEDVRKGAVVLPAGTRLSAHHVCMAAGVGLTHLDVRRRVRVAVFSTGDEITEAGCELGGSAVYDANRPLLIEMARTLGAEVSDLGILRDDEESLVTALSAAAGSHDLVVTSGGVSTGEADHVKNAVERVGKLVFWRIAIKPGRPVALAVLRGKVPGHDAAFAGLPGNPVAAFVTFGRIVRPLLLQMAGALPEMPVALPVKVAFAYRKKSGRREFVRVSLRQAADGTLEAIKHDQDGAGVISSLTATDGLLELPEDMTQLEAGTNALFVPYAMFMGCL